MLAPYNLQLVHGSSINEIYLLVVKEQMTSLQELQTCIFYQRSHAP